jgi:ABC-2 type transport system permease protein
MPIATVTSGFVNMILTFIVIFVVLIFSGRGINPLALLCLPIVMIVEYILCLGIAMIVAALTVYFRDLQYILGIVTMALQYMTPVMYGSEMVPDWALPIFKANPMTPIIEMYREILYYKMVPNLLSLVYVLVIGILFIALGFFCFNKLQKGFAENF